MNRQMPRVLVAHGESSAAVLCQELERAGYAVQIAEDGGDVLLLCDLDPPDVLVMDLDLPDMDGFEVCACVRRETLGADLTMIVLAEPGDQMTRAYLGQMIDYVDADYFFTKPCDAKVLIQLLDDLLSHSVAEEETGRRSHPAYVTWPTSRPRAMTLRC